MSTHHSPLLRPEDEFDESDELSKSEIQERVVLRRSRFKVFSFLLLLLALILLLLTLTPYSYSLLVIKVPYEYLFWGVFIVTATFFVVDRFAGPNAFGSQSGGFLPPPCFPGGGCLNFTSLGPEIAVSIRFFDVFNRATGRLFIAVTPFLLMTQTKVIENWFAEHHPAWLDIGK